MGPLSFHIYWTAATHLQTLRLDLCSVGLPYYNAKLLNIICLLGLLLAIFISYTTSPTTTLSLLNLKEGLFFFFKDHFPRLFLFHNCLNPIVWPFLVMCELVFNWWLCTLSWHLFVPAFKSLAKTWNKIRQHPALWGSASTPFTGAVSGLLCHYPLFMTSQPAIEFMWPYSLPRQSELALE